MRRFGIDDSLRCSFCHKAQGAVKKLISSPSDYPRAYICDECIAVCNHVIEDDVPEDASPALDEIEAKALGNLPHELLAHPLASEFLASLENWIRQESLGGDAAEELAEMRRLATRMMQSSTK
ncbi:MAG: ClpX C4-type zinc finger protein [Bryobacteraceae bacterium]